MIRRRYEQDQSCVDINLVPMIDMMLFLLIFFVVNSTFVREVGLEVPKPKAVSAAALPSSSLVFSITAQNKIVHGDRVIEPESVRSVVEHARTGNQDLSVIIVADGRSNSRALVELIDACKTAGASSVSIATEKDAGE